VNCGAYCEYDGQGYACDLQAGHDGFHEALIEDDDGVYNGDLVTWESE